MSSHMHAVEYDVKKHSTI